MASTNVSATSITLRFKSELFQGVHNLTGHVLKVALFTRRATLSRATTAYRTRNETRGTGYTAGGLVLGRCVLQNDSRRIVWFSFANPVWTSATFTARYALIYNARQRNRAIAVLDFGEDQACVTDTFTILIPTATRRSAILRLA